MSYTPINWQTGQTITAEKLNKMDNGWGFESTQLFSETVTTTDVGYGFPIAQLTYSQLITADTITVTFDGTEYTCPSIGEGEYGAPYSDDSFDFSEFPFNLFTSESGGASLCTQTAGEHTVAVTAPVLQTSADFAEAVSATIGGKFYPLVIGTTTWSQVVDAMAAGKLVVRTWGESYDGGTTDDTQYAGLELVMDAYVSSHGDYVVSVIVTEKGVQSINSYNASAADGALS